jgi:hypothetical protein
VNAAECDAMLRRLDRISELGPYLYRLELLADDVGRLRGHLASIVDDFESTYCAHVVERMGCHVDRLDSWARPTAGELVKAGVPVDEALVAVDRHGAELERRLDSRPRRTAA